MYVFVHRHACRCLHRSGEGSRCPGAGFSATLNQEKWVLRTKFWSRAGVTSACNRWAISLEPYQLFLQERLGFNTGFNLSVLLPLPVLHALLVAWLPHGVCHGLNIMRLETEIRIEQWISSTGVNLRWPSHMTKLHIGVYFLLTSTPPQHCTQVCDISDLS